jgi:hypothetical protein
VRQTHDLVFDHGSVLKRYVACERGEHVREWTVLQALSRHAPDLVPRPLAADLDANPPWVRMSRLPGRPLGGALSQTQLHALELALRRMWAVPVDGLPPRRFHPEEARRVISKGLAGSARPDGLAGQAYDLCVAHLARPVELAGHPIVGHGDANLSNYLWDGVSIRVVDFEDAGVSDVDYELGFLVEHLSTRATDWDPFLRRFSTDDGRLRAARLTSAAHWLLLLLPGGPAARRNPPDMLDNQAKRIFSLTGLPLAPTPPSMTSTRTSRIQGLLHEP